MDPAARTILRVDLEDAVVADSDLRASWCRPAPT